MAESSIDNHPQRDKIIRDIDAGKSVRIIAASTSPPLHYTVVQRYRTSRLKKTVLNLQHRGNSTTSASKDWVETKYVKIVDTAMRGKRPDLPTARSALDSLCRLHGYDAPRRSESLNLHAYSGPALLHALSGSLAALPQDARAKLLADPAIAAEVQDVEIIAPAEPTSDTK